MKPYSKIRNQPKEKKLRLSFPKLLILYLVLNLLLQLIPILVPIRRSSVAAIWLSMILPAALTLAMVIFLGIRAAQISKRVGWSILAFLLCNLLIYFLSIVMASFIFKLLQIEGLSALGAVLVLILYILYTAAGSCLAFLIAFLIAKMRQSYRQCQKKKENKDDLSFPSAR